MNKLCCKINPAYICKCCDMNVCDTCYSIGIGVDGENTNYVRKVMWHEEGAQCPAGANTWVNEADDEPFIIFGKV